MGQKIHPGGFRIGIIHDWKSNWFSEKEFGAYLIEDVRIREHIRGKLSHAGLSDIHIRKDSQRITIDIYTARPGIVIGKSGSEVDALRQDVHAMTAQGRADQHQRDQAPRARRQAGRPVGRRAAAEPRLVPARHEALAGLGHALGRPGRAHPLRRPPRRRGDVAHRAVLRGSRPAAHAARGHRLRLRRGADAGSAASASRSGSTRARSCPRATRAPSSRRRAWARSTRAAGAASRRSPRTPVRRGPSAAVAPAAAVAVRRRRWRRRSPGWRRRTARRRSRRRRWPSRWRRRLRRRSRRSRSADRARRARRPRSAGARPIARPSRPQRLRPQAPPAGAARRGRAARPRPRRGAPSAAAAPAGG